MVSLAENRQENFRGMRMKNAKNLQMKNAKNLLKGKLAYFISIQQRAIILTLLPKKEGEFFIDKINGLDEIISSMPEHHGTEGMGELAVLHYFLDCTNWYIIEKESSEIQFGLTDLGICKPKLGYIRIQELVEKGADLDLYWMPKTIKEIMNTYSV